MSKRLFWAAAWFVAPRPCSVVADRGGGAGGGPGGAEVAVTSERVLARVRVCLKELTADCVSVATPLWQGLGCCF